MGPFGFAKKKKKIAQLCSSFYTEDSSRFVDFGIDFSLNDNVEAQLTRLSSD